MFEQFRENFCCTRLLACIASTCDRVMPVRAGMFCADVADISIALSLRRRFVLRALSSHQLLTGGKLRSRKPL